MRGFWGGARGLERHGGNYFGVTRKQVLPTYGAPPYSLDMDNANTTSKQAWQTVGVWDDDGNKQTGKWLVRALSEYRRTGGMYLLYLADPTATDIDLDDLPGLGPKVTEIDWTGFPEVDE